MNKLRIPSLRINPSLIGLIGSALMAALAASFEPRLLPPALTLGPALIGLGFPPGGRRVFRDLGLAGLITSVVISTMLFMPSPV